MSTCQRCSNLCIFIRFILFFMQFYGRIVNGANGRLQRGWICPGDTSGLPTELYGRQVPGALGLAKPNSARMEGFLGPSRVDCFLISLLPGVFRASKGDYSEAPLNPSIREEFGAPTGTVSAPKSPGASVRKGWPAPSDTRGSARIRHRDYNVPQPTGKGV